MRVYVYYNLHKHCFSVRALEGPEKGRVVQHCNNILLEDVQFRVSQAGRDRVLRERRKNVHAGAVGHVIGDLTSYPGLVDRCTRSVTYNPYKYSTFVYSESQQPCAAADFALLTNRQIFVN